MSALVEALSRFRSQEGLQKLNLRPILDEFSRKLAKDEALRRDLPNASPGVWEYISYTWKAINLNSTEQVIAYDRDFVISLARFTRNLVAGVPNNQNEAYAVEPQIRCLLHNLTSFAQLEDETMYPVTLILVQTLSNIVTLNDSLGTRLWNLYTTLSENQNLFVRLLASPDTCTVNATLVLILNSINAEEQTLPRLTSPNGKHILVRLLDLTEEWVSNESENGEEEEAFTISYRLFETFLERDLASKLFYSLSVEDEPITPHQTTFLKLVDSYLRHPSTVSGFHNYSFLPEAFLDLCSYSQRSIRRSLRIDPVLAVPQSQPDTDLKNPAMHTFAQGLSELDPRLPKVSAAMVLLSQCVTTISLHSQNTGNTANPSLLAYPTVLESTRAAGFIESIVETLRLVDRFLPRIAFGKSVVASGELAMPPGSSGDTKGFAYLKRDLVRLLGTICYEQRDIQNRIRECGGIQVVMNLCVIDERNPYLQEHALFALRNILHQNSDNQAVVEALRPAEQSPT